MAAEPAIAASGAGGKAPPGCAHCGLPVPAGLIEPGAERSFCCRGCRTAYALIHGSGLDYFYRLRAAVDANPGPVRSTARTYAEFDDPAFRARYVRTGPDGSRAVELYLEGIHCAACVWMVERLPRILPGVIEARVDLTGGRVGLRWDDEAVRLSRIARVLDDLGYPAHPVRGQEAREVRRREDHRFLIRVGVAGVCAANVMVLAFALYGGTFHGIEAGYADLFRRVSAGFGVVALIWPGSVFFRGAWSALRTRAANIDLPIALALAAGGIAGLINVVRSAGEIYFDTLTMLIFLLLVGRWLHLRQRRWATDAVEMLFSLTPASVRRVTADGTEEVAIEAVNVGDVVETRAGESVPVDGVVEAGSSTIDESLLTGESRPVEVTAGRTVAAGTLNLQATLRIRTTATGSRTRVGRLMQLVAEAAGRRAPIVQFANRIAHIFVLTVIALAAVTVALWWPTDPAAALDHAVALLVVTCPCALGLATPVGLALAIGRAARLGILVKSGEAIEALARGGGRLLLDKTGTLTEGRMSVLAWVGEAGLQAVVAALEAHCAHPVARALTGSLARSPSAAPGGGEPAESTRPRGDSPDRTEGDQEPAGVWTDIRVASNGIQGVLQVPEKGGSAAGPGTVAPAGSEPIAGRIPPPAPQAGGARGQRFQVGSLAFLRACGVTVPPSWQAVHQRLLEEGLTPVIVARDGEVAAMAGLGDPLRADAAASVAALRRMGWKVGILSGDHPQIVARVAGELDVPAGEAFGGLTPEEKLRHVEELARQGMVVMVGDGVNDAAAMSAATVGIAVHGGAEVSLAAADVYLSSGGLQPLVCLIEGAGHTLRAIYRCFAVTLVYNLAAGTLAMAGLIAPWIAAVVMPLSSLTVLAMVWGHRGFRGQSGHRPGLRRAPEASAAAVLGQGALETAR